MGDDVVRQAGEDDLTRQIGAGIAFARPEIAEQYALGGAAVKGIGLGHGMGKQA
jgi:hypothetical protein